MEILPASIWDAALFDKIANLIANHWHGGWIDIGGDPTGTAQ